MASDDPGLLFRILRSYLRKQKKIPIRAASPTIGMATIRAILTFPRCPLKKPPVDTLAAGTLEPRPVELFRGEVGTLLEEGPWVAGDDPESPEVEELEPESEPEPELDVPIGFVDPCEEVVGVDPKVLEGPYGELAGADAKGVVDINEAVGVVEVELGMETVGETMGSEVERAAFNWLVVVDPKRTRMPRSVTAHATGIPSFQTVDIGLGSRVCKLYPAGSVAAVPVRTKTFVRATAAILEQTWGQTSYAQSNPLKLKLR